jgi:uncharacterized protein
VPAKLVAVPEGNVSIELNPVGVKCNLACPYCYEDPMREAGNFSPGYDLDAMKRGLEAEGGDWSLFGGEPLLMAFDDLADVLRWGFKKKGRTGVQTNGTLVTPAHVALFLECKTSVGISLDGPGELNDTRWAGTPEKTAAATAASHRAIDMLLEAGVAPSLIVTLHKLNASAERLPRLVEWLRGLDARGIKWVRLHALEVDSAEARGLELDEAQAAAAFASLMALQDELVAMRFDLFSDMAKLLLDGPAAGASCIWNGCDPLTTPAVRGVNGAGGLSNCSRTNKDGVDWVKAAAWGNDRSRVLHATAQADGGCAGCRFFFACQGQCPGTAIGGDWRNRSEQCGVWLRTFGRIEAALVQAGRIPLSWPSRRAEREALEASIVAREASGDRDHGDHWDAPDGYSHSDAGLEVHGDGGETVVHGDLPHGDHTDA